MKPHDIAFELIGRKGKWREDGRFYIGPVPMATITETLFHEFAAEICTGLMASNSMTLPTEEKAREWVEEAAYDYIVRLVE